MSDFSSQHKQIAIDVYTTSGMHLVLAAELSSGFERLESLRSVSNLARIMQELTDEALHSFARRLLLNQILRIDNMSLVETVNVSEGYAFINVVYSCSGTTIIIADLIMSDGSPPPNTPAGRGFIRRRETDGFVSLRRCGTQLDACDPYADDPDVTRNLYYLWEGGDMISLCEFAKSAVVADAFLDVPCGRNLDNVNVEARMRAVPVAPICLSDVMECMFVTAVEFTGEVTLAANRPTTVGSGWADIAVLALAKRDWVPSVGSFAMRDGDCLVVGPACRSAGSIENVFGSHDLCLDAPVNTAKARRLQAGLIAIAMDHKATKYVGGCINDLDGGEAPTITGTFGYDEDCRVEDAYLVPGCSTEQPRFQKPDVGKGASLSPTLS